MWKTIAIILTRDGVGFMLQQKVGTGLKSDREITGVRPEPDGKILEAALDDS